MSRTSLLVLTSAAIVAAIWTPGVLASLAVGFAVLAGVVGLMVAFDTGVHALTAPAAPAAEDAEAGESSVLDATPSWSPA